MGELGIDFNVNECLKGFRRSIVAHGATGIPFNKAGADYGIVTNDAEGDDPEEFAHEVFRRFIHGLTLTELVHFNYSLEHQVFDGRVIYIIHITSKYLRAPKKN